MSPCLPGTRYRFHVSFISTSRMAVYTFSSTSASYPRIIECGTSRIELQSESNLSPICTPTRWFGGSKLGGARIIPKPPNLFRLGLSSSVSYGSSCCSRADFFSRVGPQNQGHCHHDQPIHVRRNPSPGVQEATGAHRPRVSGIHRFAFSWNLAQETF
jgi:hypothetical protein